MPDICISARGRVGSECDTTVWNVTTKHTSVIFHARLQSGSRKARAAVCDTSNTTLVSHTGIHGACVHRQARLLAARMASE